MWLWLFFSAGHSHTDAARPSRFFVSHAVSDARHPTDLSKSVPKAVMPDPLPSCPIRFIRLPTCRTKPDAWRRRGFSSHRRVYPGCELSQHCFDIAKIAIILSVPVSLERDAILPPRHGREPGLFRVMVRLLGDAGTLAGGYLKIVWRDHHRAAKKRAPAIKFTRGRLHRVPPALGRLRRRVGSSSTPPCNKYTFHFRMYSRCSNYPCRP